MNDLRTSSPICAETVPSLLTAVRGKVRRLAQGVEKQRAELLASQIKERVPGDALKFQAALMAGECLPVRKAIEEHSPQVWATLQTARARMAGGER